VRRGLGVQLAHYAVARRAIVGAPDQIGIPRAIERTINYQIHASVLLLIVVQFQLNGANPATRTGGRVAVIFD
jgi:hypothetical protein